MIKVDVTLGMLASVLGVMLAVAPGGNIWLSAILAFVLYAIFSEFKAPHTDDKVFENIMLGIRLACVAWGTVLVAQQASLEWLTKEGAAAIEDASFAIREQKSTGRLSSVQAFQIEMPDSLIHESSYVVQSLGESNAYAVPTSTILQRVKSAWLKPLETFLQLIGGMLFIFALMIRGAKVISASLLART